MIDFQNINNNEPYRIFQENYKKALKANQESLEAVSISSYNKQKNEVESRFVNLKYIVNDEWIFFTNYNSKKAQDFLSHPQITCLIYWHKINSQIRIKAKVKRTSKEFNDNYFINRSKHKNALAISSDQSKPIDSYESVVKNYNKSLQSDNLKKCPDYWGGYSFTPYYFEFWEGHESRLNKRVVYQQKVNSWEQIIFQP
jgi:pyridoxamine 5'-phosphate oxidase